MNVSIKSGMNPSVSVVIPTYNGAPFIGETLSAIFAQTLSPDEVLILDDCSTDETESVVASTAKDAPIPIRFERLPQNTGNPSKPLNVGISKAIGEVILTLDQDDLMRPRRVEASLKALRAFPNSGFAIGRFSILGFAEGDLRQVWPTAQFSDISDYIDSTAEFSLLDSKPAFAALLLKNFAGSTSNFCFTKSLWEKIGGFDETVNTCSDLDFILRVVVEIPIVIINEVLFDYRWRASSLNHSNSRKTDLELTKVRLLAASAKPEWAGDQRLVLEDAAVHAARLALKRGDLTELISVLDALLKNGQFGSLLKRKLSRPKDGGSVRDAPRA
jgi:glycosyltransferase involved in cell wall biosynthesis